MNAARPRHTSTHWVVWLCVAVWLALVPLRSWAKVTMPLAHSSASAANSSADSAMPCHDAPVQPAQSPHSLCTDCALCHAVAAPAPSLMPAAPHRAATHWHLPSSLPVLGRAAETPFKPPRA